MTSPSWASAWTSQQIVDEMRFYLSQEKSIRWDKIEPLITKYAKKSAAGSFTRAAALKEITRDLIPYVMKLYRTYEGNLPPTEKISAKTKNQIAKDILNDMMPEIKYRANILKSR